MFRSFLLCGEENEQLRITGAEMGELRWNARRGRREGEEFNCVESARARARERERERERERRTKIKDNNKIIR